MRQPAVGLLWPAAARGMVAQWSSAAGKMPAGGYGPCCSGLQVRRCKPLIGLAASLCVAIPGCHKLFASICQVAAFIALD